jgi:hypothetical protein
MSARAFIRYASARMDAAEREELYRVYVTEHLRALCMSDASYYEIAHGQADFDAEQVMDDVISKMGLEEA